MFRPPFFGAGLLMLFLAVTTARAQFPPSPDSPPPVKRPRMLLLTSGRIVEGQIEDSPGGYVVRMAAGHLVVPYTQVRFEADGLDDAYRKLSATMPERSATNHLWLAKWCVEYHLYTRAKYEVTQALLLEPDREEARRLLVRIDETLNPKTLVKPQPVQPPEQILQNHLVAPRQSLSGLPRPVAAQFVSRVQPLLLNKCGNVACHGSQAKNGFQLLHVGIQRRSHQRQTETNLEAVMKYVDMQVPDNSQLLWRVQRPHGESLVNHKQALSVRQVEEIKSWLQAVTGQLLEENKPRPTPEQEAQGPEAALPGSPQLAQPPGDPIVSPPGFTKNILQEESPDAFDPAEFNQRFGTGPGRKIQPTP